MIGSRIVLGSRLKVKKPMTDDEIVKNPDVVDETASEKSADGTTIAENQNEVQIVSDTSLNLTTN